MLINGFRRFIDCPFEKVTTFDRTCGSFKKMAGTGPKTLPAASTNLLFFGVSDNFSVGNSGVGSGGILKGSLGRVIRTFDCGFFNVPTPFSKFLAGII